MSTLDLSLSDRLRGLSDKLPPEHKNLLLEAALRVDTLELKERAWKPDGRISDRAGSGIGRRGEEVLMNGNQTPGALPPLEERIVALLEAVAEFQRPCRTCGEVVYFVRHRQTRSLAPYTKAVTLHSVFVCREDQQVRKAAGGGR